MLMVCFNQKELDLPFAKTTNPVESAERESGNPALTVRAESLENFRVSPTPVFMAPLTKMESILRMPPPVKVVTNNVSDDS